jgi:hypothetical protein
MKERKLISDLFEVFFKDLRLISIHAVCTRFPLNIIFVNHLPFHRKEIIMKNLFSLLCVLAVIGTASAALVPNGDFESTVGTAAGWDVWTGGGSVVAREYTTGGNPDGYVDLAAPVGAGWFGWYQVTPLPFEVLGAPAGSTITLQADMKSFDTNFYAAGIKLEGVGGYAAEAEATGPITSNWETYSVDLITDSTNTGLTFSLMCLAGESGERSTDGFDNCELIVGGKALFPVPTVGALLPYDTTTLTWANPASVGYVDAYLLESDVPLNDPNLGPDVFDPGVMVLTVTGNSADVTGLLIADKYYYWAVHVTEPNTTVHQGFTWNFLASGDSIPVVDAGVDQYLETTGSPMVLDLSATVTDDGAPTITWTDISNAGGRDQDTVVTINNATAAYTTVTLENLVSGIVNGWYQFQITVDDGVNLPVTDQVTVGVYGTCKEAAVADPDDTYDAVGDLDGSCKVDLVDFALFAQSWLDCDALRVTCP